jgi:hypothetical protein
VEIDMKLEVVGLAEALKTLSKVDPELRKAVLKDMKAAAAPLEAAARANVPARPLTNWGNWERNRTGHGGPGRFEQSKAQRGIKVAFRGGKVKGKSGDHFPLLSLRQTDWPGAIFEMAGRAGGFGKRSEKAARGQMMIGKLNTFGTASRTLWPAVERNFGAVESALTTVIENMSGELEKMLEKGAP